METLYEVEKRVEDWNSKYPPGTRVVLTDDLDQEHETVTRSPAWVIGGHTAVVEVEGRAGGYSLSRITPQSQGNSATGGEMGPEDRAVICQLGCDHLRFGRPPCSAVGQVKAAYAQGGWNARDWLRKHFEPSKPRGLLVFPDELLEAHLRSQGIERPLSERDHEGNRVIADIVFRPKEETVEVIHRERTDGGGSHVERQ